MTGNPSRRDFKKTHLFAQTETEQPDIPTHLVMAGFPRRDKYMACSSKPPEDDQTPSKGSS